MSLPSCPFCCFPVQPADRTPWGPDVYAHSDCAAQAMYDRFEDVRDRYSVKEDYE